MSSSVCVVGLLSLHTAPCAICQPLCASARGHRYTRECGDQSHCVSVFTYSILRNVEERLLRLRVLSLSTRRDQHDCDVSFT